MQIQSYEIIPRLRLYVKMICTMNCDEETDTNQIRVLPDACVELFVNYTSTPIAVIENELYKRSIISFRMNRPVDVQMRKGAGCLAICFYPGMAYKFFQVPMCTLASVSGILLGSGKSLFHKQNKSFKLTLQKSKTYKTGLVSLWYTINK